MHRDSIDIIMGIALNLSSVLDNVEVWYFDFFFFFVAFAQS